MDLLKSLPISFTGKLNNVEIIAISVAENEIKGLPERIKPVIENGRVLFSVVNVELTQMKASLAPIPFKYRHVAIRMCVEDSEFNTSKENQGVYFWSSFTDKPLMVAGGRLLTEYNLKRADIKVSEPVFQLRSDDQFLNYALDKNQPKDKGITMFSKIQRLNRAYFDLSGTTYRTKIQRSEWPIQWADCYAFETNIFNDVKVEGAFFIDEAVDYKWQKPEKITF